MIGRGVGIAAAAKSVVDEKPKPDFPANVWTLSEEDTKHRKEKGLLNLRSPELKMSDADQAKEYRTRMYLTREKLIEESSRQGDKKPWMLTPCVILTEPFQKKSLEANVTGVVIKGQAKKMGTFKFQHVVMGPNYGNFNEKATAERHSRYTSYPVCREPWCLAVRHHRVIENNELKMRMEICPGCKISCPVPNCGKTWSDKNVEAAIESLVGFPIAEKIGLQLCQCSPRCAHYTFMNCIEHSEQNGEAMVAHPTMADEVLGELECTSEEELQE